MIKSYLRILKSVGLVSLFFPILVTFCSYRVLGLKYSSAYFHESFLFLGIVGVFVLVIIRYSGRLDDSVERLAREQTAYIDRINSVYISIAIVASAGVSLFFELAVIRWHSAVFPVFAFYKNFSLLACFAGLGIGYALAKRDSIPLFFSIPVLSGQILLLTFLRYAIGDWRTFSIMITPVTERLDMGLPEMNSGYHIVAIYSLLFIIFLLTALAFIPVGQLCGRLMARTDNLRAYGYNLLGSVAGVALILGVSMLWTPPVVWISIIFLSLLAFQTFHSRLLYLNLAVSFISVIILSWPVYNGYEKIYSPYQLLERGPGSHGLSVVVAAGHFYQKFHDLSYSNANRSVDKELQHLANYYELPYKMFGKPIDRVAIVGAGTGNDVAAALRQGAARVDAVEIDPAIWKLGELYHPEKPYDNPRVNSVITDARTFLRNTDRKYDMIVYGLLDSHTLLSHASSVRLDSFVYTVEGLKEARSRLREGGAISLSFCIISPQIGRKIYLMMQQAFEGISPVCIKYNAPQKNDIIFMQTKDGSLSLDENLLQRTGYIDVTNFFASPEIKADVSTDDWPFFYMPQRIYPKSYLGVLALILVLTVYITYAFFDQDLTFSSPVFCFLGAGFMLVETKAITELGLVFGNTWYVIGFVILGILFMAFLANCCVQWFKLSNPIPAFIFIVISLIAGYFVSKQNGFDSSFTGKISALILLTCPMFFSGIVFSSLLSRTKGVAGVMAVNLIGAMLGGILEYNSMYFGFSFLYLIAICVYLLAIGSYYLQK